MLHQRFSNANRRCGDGDWPRRSLLRRCLSLILFLSKHPLNSQGRFCGTISGNAGAFLIAAVLCLAIGSKADAQDELTLSAPSNQQPLSQTAPTETVAQARASIEWLARKAIELSPRTYDGDKSWGNQKSLWAGVKVRFDDGKLKTKRRKRKVNHGRWIQYEVTLPPLARTDEISLSIDEVKELSDEDTGVMRIKSTLSTPMTFTARIQRWNLGIRVFSVTVTGRMRVRLRSVMTLRMQPDYSEIPPALILGPKIEDADLKLEAFEVDRVSRVGGDVAEAWGEVMQEVMVERFIDRASDKLAGKLNKSIDKNRDKLRLSMTDWLSGWSVAK